jgi:hypothetical protein
MGRPRRELTTPTVHPALQRYNEAVDEIERARQAVAYWSEERAQALVDLMADGFTLAAVADVLGVSKQALSQAVKRFDAMIAERWVDVRTAELTRNDLEAADIDRLALTGRTLERARLWTQLAPEAKARVRSGESSITAELRAAGLTE